MLWICLYAEGCHAGSTVGQSVAYSNDIFEHAYMDQELPRRVIRILSRSRDRPGEEAIAEVEVPLGPSRTQQ